MAKIAVVDKFSPFFFLPVSIFIIFVSSLPLSVSAKIQTLLLAYKQ